MMAQTVQGDALAWSCNQPFSPAAGRRGRGPRTPTTPAARRPTLRGRLARRPLGPSAVLPGPVLLGQLLVVFGRDVVRQFLPQGIADPGGRPRDRPRPGVGPAGAVPRTACPRAGTPFFSPHEDGG